MKSQRSKHSGVFTLVLTLHLAASLLIACAAKSNNPTPIHRIDAMFRLREVIYSCGSVGRSYKPSLLQRFLTKLMVSLDNAVQVNSLGTDLIFNEVNENSYDPLAVKFHYQIRPIGADPDSPTLTPTATTDPGDPISSANVNATITANNSSATSAYEDKLTANHNLLNEEKAREQKATTAFLNSYHPVQVPRTDLYGCVASASEFFATEPGVHILLIAADHINTILLNQNAKVNLRGVTIKVVYRLCVAGAPLCQAQDDLWRQYFLAHGAKETDIAILSPEASDALATLF